MALVREHTAFGGCFDTAETMAFDALGYGHDSLLGFDAAALFGAGRPTSAVVGANAWASTGSASVLAFDRATSAAPVVEEEEECDAWIDAMDQSYGAPVTAPVAARYAPTASVGFDSATGCFTLKERASSSAGAGRSFGLIFPSTSSSSGGSPEPTPPASASRKCNYVDAEPLAIDAKKPCGAGRKTSKAKAAAAIPTKDPQSLAAKNRRERISERLRTLQELVPNGTKVDLVTMLEKAISYVKFLQLQVKVLATDEFWPAQGGKAPEISQVREALDAILSSASQRGELN
ncbi:hypothetical protein HU200_012400 [Digitaria exilis]|uniref:BHLH domain-containing protein n=1 Tax=Digitaria exilis TaxID=1010633 RepID=A0A835KPN7_9POAL|nr:hypothetical protein HU200_012400 [Digitaria exilis]CAB3447693.1 unnamed protein product [Digitaria exilis]